ncbi:MAG: hypothetical protein F6K65_33695 [Moorea sp. SIO3C2]|nr:hypothetical protein [Moorena sp. SIO3C2]
MTNNGETRESGIGNRESGEQGLVDVGWAVSIIPMVSFGIGMITAHLTIHFNLFYNLFYVGGQ